eukprot:scaffold74319_cov72-Phaeocystis_antarctica.AAC.5
MRERMPKTDTRRPPCRNTFSRALQGCACRGADCCASAWPSPHRRELLRRASTHAQCPAAAGVAEPPARRRVRRRASAAAARHTRRQDRS